MQSTSYFLVNHQLFFGQPVGLIYQQEMSLMKHTIHEN